MRHCLSAPAAPNADAATEPMESHGAEARSRGPELRPGAEARWPRLQRDSHGMRRQGSVGSRAHQAGLDALLDAMLHQAVLARS